MPSLETTGFRYLFDEAGEVVGVLRKLSDDTMVESSMEEALEHTGRTPEEFDEVVAQPYRELAGLPAAGPAAMPAEKPKAAPKKRKSKKAGS